MKRTLALVVLCALLLSTVGATVAVAKPTKPTMRQFTDIDFWPDYQTGSGKLTVDMKEQWYVFSGKRLTPGLTYYIYIDTQYSQPLGQGVADVKGKINIAGPCTFTLDQLNAIQLVELSTRVTPKLTLTMVPSHPTEGTPVTWTVTSDVPLSDGTVLKLRIHVDDEQAADSLTMTRQTEVSYSYYQERCMERYSLYPCTAYVQLNPTDLYNYAVSNSLSW